MTDEPTPADEPTRVPTGIVPHWCEEPGCEKWGSFGEQYGKSTRWFCGQHRTRD